MKNTLKELAPYLTVFLIIIGVALIHSIKTDEKLFINVNSDEININTNKIIPKSAPFTLTNDPANDLVITQILVNP